MRQSALHELPRHDIPIIPATSPLSFVVIGVMEE
jgi:hypothetical protein